MNNLPSVYSDSTFHDIYQALSTGPFQLHVHLHQELVTDDYICLPFIDKMDAYKEAYSQLDTTGDGKLDVNEMSAFLRSMGVDVSDDIVQSVIDGISSDGTVDFDAFVRMIEEYDEANSSSSSSGKFSFIFSARGEAKL